MVFSLDLILMGSALVLRVCALVFRVFVLVPCSQGIGLIQELIVEYGFDVVQAYMNHIQVSSTHIPPRHPRTPLQP